MYKPLKITVLGENPVVKNLLLLSSLVFFSSTSTAAVVYTYQSANFDMFTDNPVPAGSSSAGCIVNCNFNSGDRISGFFSLGSPLAGNLVSDIVSPDSFAFSAGAVSLSSSDPDLSEASFEITTDASGNIVNWYVFASIGGLFSGGPVALGEQTKLVEFKGPGSEPAFDNGGIFECTLLDTFGCASFSFDDALVEGQPGNWSSEIVSAIPIPAAVWLFGTALVGFIGFSRRRNIV